MATKGKERAAMFTATEQQLLLESYEEFKHMITKKGNTAAINKTRENGWQEIADRLNASKLSEEKRTWQQVKIKYKNIVQNAAKKKSEVAGTGGGPPIANFTPAEELALDLNKGRPVIEGIEGGTASGSIPSSIRDHYLKVMPNYVCFLDPPDIMLNPVEGPSTVEEDEETVSVCSSRPEDADTLLEPSQSGTTCDQVSIKKLQKKRQEHYIKLKKTYIYVPTKPRT
ncbi:uncharacterized protein LOC143742400 [Siphateles boraxobius]|uniref:uncharacterized protein LOC143742400 n=1 Tax=Siphateles boraxobius TaxID=180520 RepID=UPI0040639E55